MCLCNEPTALFDTCIYIYVQLVYRKHPQEDNHTHTYIVVITVCLYTEQLTTMWTSYHRTKQE